MPFIPHTEQDIKEMLALIGVPSIETLFEEIPDSLRHASLDDVPLGISEMALGRIMHARSAQDGGLLCFSALALTSIIFLRRFGKSLRVVNFIRRIHLIRQKQAKAPCSSFMSFKP